MAKDLKAKLQNDLAAGKVTLSSADIAEFNAEQVDKKNEPVPDKVLTDVPKQAKQDELMNAGADGDPGKAIDAEVLAHRDVEAAANDLSGSRESVDFEQVEITKVDRELFLAALVTGDRFVLPFSLFNGKVTGKFRSRLQAESQAIVAQLNREVTGGQIITTIDYATRMRNLLLATQVAELLDEVHLPLKEPLMQTVTGEKDATILPGWLGQANLWCEKSEGLISALYSELQLFESKYWVMVNNAREQNFWNPAESTSG